MKIAGKKKKALLSFHSSIFLLIFGILLGTVFTFGMQHWNAPVDRSSCLPIETQWESFDEIHSLKHPSHIKQIAVDCSNGQRYFIDGACIDAHLIESLVQIQPNDEITILRHPNSNTILQLATDDQILMDFDSSIQQLAEESNAFRILGIFMYFGAFVGLLHLLHRIFRFS